MKLPNQKLTIVGAKKSKGEFEGRPFDSTKVYVHADLRNDKDQGRGVSTVEYAWGESGNFDKISHLPFPFEAEVDLVMVTSGKGTSALTIEALRPVKAAAKAA